MAHSTHLDHRESVSLLDVILLDSPKTSSSSSLRIAKVLIHLSTLLVESIKLSESQHPAVMIPDATSTRCFRAWVCVVPQGLSCWYGEDLMVSTRLEDLGIFVALQTFRPSNIWTYAYIVREEEDAIAT